MTEDHWLKERNFKLPGLRQAFGYTPILCLANKATLHDQSSYSIFMF